jgi:stage V sporulation protein D (sporulation-specific penicillin-binding protein)
MNRQQTDKVEALAVENGLRGLITTESSRRYYPYADLAGPVLGFLNDDGEGAYGLEASYEELLKGTPGRLLSSSEGDIPGNADTKTYAAEDGYNLVLTLNVDIQRATEDLLVKAVQRYAPKERGMAIVMDVNTGAILAMVTEPDFDPNQPYMIYDTAMASMLASMPEGEERTNATSEALYRQWRNKTISDTYEPGSVMKVITAAAALDSGTYNTNSGFYCGGSIEVADHTIGCASGQTHNHISLSNALIESCNVSFVQIAQGLGVGTWYNYVNGFGFTEPTGIDLPGEPSQISLNYVVYPEDRMGPSELASCSFGQSNQYSALQMITAISATVNGGNLVQPHMVSQIVDSQDNVVQQLTPEPKRQVISEETSAVLCGILEDLVNSPTGYGRNAYVPGYHVGGKSGTSEKLNLMNTEGREEYISSFVAFAPADDPQIAVLVVLDEPVDDLEQNNRFGGRLAGPTVGGIISAAVNVLGIEPDYEQSELSRTSVQAPRVQGEVVTTAMGSLTTQGFTSKVIGNGAMVLGQYPEVGTQMPYGGVVVLYTEEGVTQQTAGMPDLNGKGAQTAIETLKSLGLNVMLQGAPESGANIVVAEQSIPAGTELPLGYVVMLSLQDVSAVTDR